LADNGRLTVRHALDGAESVATPRRGRLTRGRPASETIRVGATISRLNASASTEAVGSALRTDRAVIVEGVLAPDLLARFNAEIDPLLDGVSPKRALSTRRSTWSTAARDIS